MPFDGITKTMLEYICINFPATSSRFPYKLLSFLSSLGEVNRKRIKFSTIPDQYFPEIRLAFDSPSGQVNSLFGLSGGEYLSVPIENITGKNVSNTDIYQKVMLKTVKQRLSCSGISMTGIDHIGFNLPWFDSGIHPSILKLRKKLSGACLYHRFPGGEPWDFILPGSADEIKQRTAVDYSIPRRPKFELVSFDKCSRPLVQLDISLRTSYEALTKLFPESIADHTLRNIWVYMSNPYNIDICLVLNEAADGDWSGFFEGYRVANPVV
jgi:hypothetical protein